MITYFMRDDEPVFLLTVISKGQQASLTAGQTASLKKMAKDEKRGRR